MNEFSAPVIDDGERQEIAERVLHGLLDTVAPAACLNDPHSIQIAQRRLVALAFALERPGYEHTSGAEIARQYGVTKQSLNLDMKIIQRAFRISFPTAHRTTNGKPPSWCRDV